MQPSSLAFLILLLPSSRPLGAQCPVQDLAPSSAGPEASVGFALALDGDPLLLGAHRDDAQGVDSGRVVVYERSAAGAPFAQRVSLVGSDTSAGDAFGLACDLRGNLAVVGAMLADSQDTDAGAAYVFERTDTTWRETARLVAADLVQGDWFGIAVATDGERIAVGAREKNTGAPRSGAVYVFERDTSGWVETTRLAPPQPLGDALFGHSIDLEGDTLVVGAFGDGGLGSGEGRTYVYRRSGGAWTLEATLLPADAGANDWFGIDVDLVLHPTGQRIVAGSRKHDGAGQDAGAAYVFEEGPSGMWQESAQLLAPDAAPFDEFGNKVAAAGDRIVVGAWHDRDFGPETGSAYSYRLTPGGWQLQGKLVAPDAAAGDVWGHGLALDGDLALIGGFLHDGAAAASGGALLADLGQPAGGRPGCGAPAHSGGVAARLDALGPASLAANRTTLRLVGGPAGGVPALFAVSNAGAAVPFGDGLLCLAAPWQRLGLTALTDAGNRKLDLDWSTPPLASVRPGDALHFQVLFRDPQSIGAGYGTSSSLVWTACP